MTSAASSTIAASICALVLALPAAAHADPSHADALFKEGRTLLDAKRFDEACPKLAESEKLEPGAGTLVALSMCHEGQGKTASAWRDLREASALGKKNGRADLASAADKRAAALEPSLPHLVVRVPEGSKYDVQLDGERAETLDKPFAVDPGEHKVDVSGEGKRSRAYVVKLAAGGQVEIVVDKLEDVPPPVVLAPPPKSAPIRVEPITEPPPVESDANRGSAQRLVGGGLIAAGVIGLGTGAYFAGRALSLNADAQNASDASAHDRAKAAMNVSLVSFAAGTGAITAGAVLYILSPRSTSKAQITPEVGPSFAGVGMRGVF
ncbi:MAG TPA: hypothetical protein VIF62_24795 [Labilithrix sp.]